MESHDSTMVTSEELRPLAWETSHCSLWCQFCGAHQNGPCTCHTLRGWGKQSPLLRVLQQRSLRFYDHKGPLDFRCPIPETSYVPKLQPFCWKLQQSKHCRCLNQSDLDSGKPQLFEVWFHILVHPWISTVFHSLERWPWQECKMFHKVQGMLLGLSLSTQFLVLSLVWLQS